MPLAQPPPMVRMGDGSYQPATSFVGKADRPKKFLVVVQYYDGDRTQAEELLNLIADLERIRNRTADILVFSRFDATPLGTDVRTKLEAKFDKVFFQACRRKGAKTYPFSANEMFYDLVTLVGQYPPWRDDYFAFINLETDCTPLHPGWIAQLSEQFKYANARGKHLIGDQQPNHQVPHVNGVAVYDIHIWQLVGSSILSGGDPQVAYDMYHGASLLPISEDTPAIAFKFQLPTITPEDLFKAHKGGGVEPAVFHGVKDGSARAAVRARHVNFTDEREVSNKTVFTFYRPYGLVGSNEGQALISLWRDAWLSRGWNPVVLGAREAAQNSKSAELKRIVSRFPGVKDPLDQFERWLALETVGGGLLVDDDVMPARFTPSHALKDGTTIYDVSGEAPISAAKVLRADVAAWTQKILDFTPKPDTRVVTDSLILGEKTPRRGLVMPYGVLGYTESPLVQFTAESVAGGRKSQVVETFLRQ